MKKRTILCYLLIVALFAVFLTGCSNNSNNEPAQKEVYEDMKQSFDKANLLSSNIGIFSKTEDNGTISYSECGSGVIIEKKDNTYYALTAAHVVSHENVELLVFTTNTEMKSESIPGFDDTAVLSSEVYDSMYKAKLLYTSKRDDLAAISFESNEKLSVIELADSDPQKGNRIMCVGNPENDWFSISYGKVTSEIESFGEFQGYPCNAMKHSAYIQVGSSGGAAINEDMKLAGTTPGASLSLDGTTFEYGVLIPVSEIRLCLNDWKSQQ